MRRSLPVLAFCLLLSGCYVGVDHAYGHVHYDDCGCENEYAVGFTASVLGGSYAPTTHLECACETSVELALSARNDGPYGDSYHADGGYTHRFLVYDEWGWLVWDSWHHHHDNGLHQEWDLPPGATITFSEVWDLTDDEGYALPPGRYTVEPRFTGELEAGRRPPTAAPLIIDILPGGIG